MRLHDTLLNLCLSATALALAAAPASGQVGTALWQFDLANVSGAFVSVGPDGTIYTVDQNRLWALDPSGAVRWSFAGAAGQGGLASGGGGSPVDFLQDGRLVVAAGHTLWALEPDGSVSWSFSWTGTYNNQIDNGPSVGPDGNVYATTAVNGGHGMGVFSLTPDGQLRWQDDASPALVILNASHGQRMRFTDSRVVFGFIATTGSPRVYAFDFDGDQTNLVNYTCTSSPKTNGVDRLLLAGVCGVQSIDLATDTIEWSVSLGPINMLPIADTSGVVYSGRWHGPASAISPQGQILWTSPDVGVQRTLAVSEPHGVFLYAGETFGQPNWFGAVDSSTGASLWQLPFETVGGHNELSWSNEAAFSPDGTVAYFTTRFTSNGAPGRLWAVRIAEPAGEVLGSSYCGPAATNSSGAPASIEAFGSLAVVENSVVLTATELPANRFGYFINSLTQGSVPMPGGSQGTLCLAGAVGRYAPAAGYPVLNSGPGGSISLTLDLASTPTPTGAVSIAAGQNWNFQAWFRDDDPGPTSNFTDAVSITFE